MEKAEAGRGPGAGGILGVALGLALLLGGLAWLALQARGAAAFDAEQALEELFPGERPLGLELVESGALPGGDRILRLRPAPAERMDGEPLPEEVVLAFYASREEAQRLFTLGAPGEGGGGAAMDAATLARWTEDPAEGASVEVERGEVSFRGWRAPFLRRRALLAGGGTREATCVDLSTPGRPLVLIALWPEERGGSSAVLRELLDGVALPEPKG